MKVHREKASIIILLVLLLGGGKFDVQASGISSIMPGGGINVALDQGTGLDATQLDGNVKLESMVERSEIEARENSVIAQETCETENEYENLVIAQTNRYVNIRNLPDKKGEVVGKFYDNAAGTILSVQGDWYEIQSGNAVGFVKASQCVVGEEAEALVNEVGIRWARVECDRLLIRKEAKEDAEVLGMVPMADELVVLEETQNWVKVDIEEGEGWVSRAFVTLYTEFEYAETVQEEAFRLAKERAHREQAGASVAQHTISAIEVTSENERGVAVAEYAVQFIGNPYVWGGTSLTQGADCSGFVMKVYENFGVSLPHSSAEDRKQGYSVNGLENALPGDLVCYSGHVAIYIGNGKIVHAANAEKGIIVSEATYRNILEIRRIF